MRELWFPNYRINLARHKKSCSAGTLHCSQCPNFSKKSQNDLNYHVAKKHSVPGPSKTYNCKLCHSEMPGFFDLRQHKTHNMDQKWDSEQAVLMWRI